MKYLIQLIVLFFYTSSLLFAQEYQNNVDLLYGLDAQLYNGEEYNTIKQKDIKGHQFFIDEEFTSGIVTIKGIKYKCEQINFDIHNQKLLFKYSHPNGSIKIIAISDAWLEEFTLNNHRFVVENRNSKKTIYQIIETDSIRLLIGWKKKLSLVYKSGKSEYYYSKPKKVSHIVLHEKIIQYNNNKSFLSAFDITKQSIIKKYLREHKIKIKKAPDEVMLSLIIFCNNIKV